MRARNTTWMFSLTLLLLFTAQSDGFIGVAPDNWHFISENPSYGSDYYFVPFGTNYWDPETFVWVGIYDPFEDYSQGLNTCGGNYDGNSDMLDWVTVAKMTSNDHILIYPPPGDFSIYQKYENPIELKDIFDGYLEGGYSDGVHLAAGNLSPNRIDEQLVISTMSKDDVILIYFYDSPAWLFNEMTKIVIPGVDGYDDGVKIACGDFDGDGVDELAVSPLYSNEHFNFIKIYKLDSSDKPYIWKQIPLETVGGLSDISIAAGDINPSGDLVRDELVLAGVPLSAYIIKQHPDIFLCEYQQDRKQFGVRYIGTEKFDSDYEGGINIACGRIDRLSNQDQLITAPISGQDHIRVYNYDPTKNGLDYLKDENNHVKGKLDNIFSDAYKRGLTLSTARLMTEAVPGTSTFRDHILIGSMDNKDVVMFRDYHPEWPNNDGWHNFGRANVITEYDAYRTEQ